MKKIMEMLSTYPSLRTNYSWFFPVPAAIFIPAEAQGDIACNDFRSVGRDGGGDGVSRHDDCSHDQDDFGPQHVD